MSAKGVFRPRKFGKSDLTELAAGRSFLADSTSDPSIASITNMGAYTGKELTKNDKYCVSRLPATPAVLRGDHELLLNGYADNTTKWAVVASEKAITVWLYTSTDENPICYEFPQDPQNLGALQLAILTHPTPGTTSDPGLAIINPTTGHTCFYESVQNAPALGMINSLLIEAHINILASQGEYITLAQNVEPAGIAVATSWKRVVLIVLRDHKGMPRLLTLELTKPNSHGFLSGWLGSSDDELADEIVSIKPGQILNHGNCQEIIVQDSAGTLRKFFYESSPSGSSVINHSKTCSYRLLSYLRTNADGVLPGSVFDVKFLDLCPVANDVCIALICFSSSMHGVDEKRLLLLTFKVDDSGVLVLGSHQLPGRNVLLVSKPALFIPQPGRTAFVVADTSVIITDLNTVPSSPEADFKYYEPQWEDTISLKASVQMIGFGYEDLSSSSNPSVVLITSNHGVLRLERFKNSDTSQNVEDPTDPVYLLKTHMQQAIYYSESVPLNFNLHTEHLLDTILTATNIVVAEVLESSSPYLPEVFPSTRDSFAMRLKTLRDLVVFVESNFADTWPCVIPRIVEAIEKLELSLNLWDFVDNKSLESTKLKIILKKVVDTHTAVKSQDVLRSFFANHVNEILPVYTALVSQLAESEETSSVLPELLVKTLYDGVVQNEITYIMRKDEIAPRKLWLFDSKVFVTVEGIYSKLYCGTSPELTTSRNILLHLTETLYFLATSAIQYMQETEDDQLRDYIQWYSHRKGVWIDALLKRGLIEEAFALAEKYQDFYSVAHVLENERNQVSPENVADRVDYFMNTYGFDFAKHLFDYYIHKNFVQRLLLEGTKYQTHLDHYFAKGLKTSEKVAGIYYILVQDHLKASKILLSNVAKQKTGNQEAIEFNLSLAKLCAMAAKFDPTNIQSDRVYDELAIEAENELLATRIQNKIHRLISLCVEDRSSLITKNYFLEHFVNQQLDKRDVASSIEPFFTAFVNQQSLTKPQLIQLLISVSPRTPFSDVFSDALKVAALINNDAEFQTEARTVWERLLCYTDDWFRITDTEGHSDEVNKMKVRDTVIFKTLRVVKDDREIMKVLHDMLDTDAEDAMDINGQSSDKVGELIKQYNIGLWIDMMCKEAM